jgi:hypothetical protein
MGKDLENEERMLRKISKSKREVPRLWEALHQRNFLI